MTPGCLFVFALSQTPRARITEEAARVLAQHGRIAPVNIAQRVAYTETGATGQGVSETTNGQGGGRDWCRVELRELDGLLNTESRPTDTGVPQRGAEQPSRKKKPKREGEKRLTLALNMVGEDKVKRRVR